MPASVRDASTPLLSASDDPKPGGQLVINADDWGRDYDTTERIHECWQAGALSSTSAMVFMQDSERAARIASEQALDVGLHLNFTTPFSSSQVSSRLRGHQEAVSRYLRSSRFAQSVYHPGLTRSFEYIARAQYDEYSRLFGAQPARIDGHHHMHLCANVLLQRLLPPSAAIRRNFSFQPHEKGFVNRCYRRMLDSWLARSRPLTDYFFSLIPLRAERLERFAALAARAIVEIETHPVNAPEYELLVAGTSPVGYKTAVIARRYAARWMGETR